MNRVVEYIIRAKDATASTLEKAMSRIKGFATGVFSNLANIKAGFDMLAGAAQNAWALLQKSVQYEKMTLQFKTLIGNIDDARVHMQMLQELGDTPPFSLEEFASASRELMKFSDGALGFKDSLELVGDAAAALGQPVEGLANLVGRAYALIRDGQPIERAGMMLRNVGAVTPEVVAKLQDMEKAGASNIELWRELEKELGRFKGAMADTEQTADGLMGAMEAQWDDAVRTFGQAFLETAKDGIGVFLNYLKQMNEDGTIALMADKVSSACDTIMDSMKSLVPVVSNVWKGIVATFDSVGSEIGRFAGAISMGEFADAFGGIGTETARAFTEAFDLDGTAEKNDELKKSKFAEEFAKKREENKRKQEAMTVEKQAKLEADMAEKQAAKEEAEYQRQLEEYYQMLNEEAEAEQKLREELAREEREQEEKRHQQRIRNIQSEVSESEKLQSDAESRLSAAKAKVSQAWGWYKDKSSMQSEIDSYNEQKAAEVQWEKDFAKLKDKRRDWRDVEFGKLSADEEAVRQVALAKEEEQAAQKALDEIAENTAYLKEIAESLSAEEGA